MSILNLFALKESTKISTLIQSNLFIDPIERTLTEAFIQVVIF
ncbi:MAG: hypothetical protein R3283_09650 [Balneolaceae bacterium]|nr:hypothetical protein [Balneolaceae bacterium]